MKKLPLDLSQLLQQQGSLPRLAEKAELLLHLNQHLKNLLNGPITAQVKVANLRHTTLVIETSTSAWAARLNFQKLKILQQLQAEVLPMLTAIEVKVNPELHSHQRKAAPQQKQISTTAAAHIQALAEHTDGALAQKLKRLAALASRSRRS